eukprot:augustus_masked-scaffold_5-processed-gene-2.6-mRNA-1 protein AED:0.08 eAED:0.08 QI:0/-1/0/1/-1/1/1/0/321
MAEDAQLLKSLSSKNYKEQAVWFLNAYWAKTPKLSEDPQAREAIWLYTHTCEELDPRKEEGNELDELSAHRLLEKIDAALTVKDMREKFREIDIDWNKKVSLTEFLVYKFGVDWTYLVKAPQATGEFLAQLQAAEAQVRKVEQAIVEAKETEKDARNLEKEMLKAKKQAELALEEVKREEEAFEKEKADLKAISEDQNLGIVKRNKAKNELFQLQAANPLPLQTALVSQEAALRKADKAKAAAEEGRRLAEESTKRCEEAFEKAQEQLEEVKAKAEAGMGKVWWLERELEESKKYMSNKQRARLEQRMLEEQQERDAALGI